eukprot:gene15640-21146_t
MKVYITGFGQFGNVINNPTSEIVAFLASLNQSDLLETLGLSNEVGATSIQFIFNVLEVSVDYCHSFINSIENSLSDKDEILIIHLGVDMSSSIIKLERFAYNNMTFSIEDARGFTPNNQLIDQTCGLDESLTSSLSIETILHSIQEKEYGRLLVQVSIDPGRYLCNYTYYSSLTHQKHQNKPLNSLFVHVPPFNAIPKNNQIMIISDIIRLCIQQVVMLQMTPNLTEI